MGHLFAISKLAKLLIDRHHFTITFINFSEYANKTQDAFLSSLPSSINSLYLPPMPLSDLPEDSAIKTRLSVAAARSVPYMHSLLLLLRSSTHLVTFITDIFATPACDAMKALKIPHLIIIPTNLLFLTLIFHLPALNAELSCDF
ncbi:hypothetical protein IEQ34_003516 [Dendrobium chrysotoxum]|uniref:Uncharacterized protein n=1 Tax=Dendrobium chrysotoxum TaxID=161865 RepID=A0AAV7HLW4_DENCH|nr:hypothetical protein IEQ34_003516 [Dendrobium chrysotoxum]